MTMKAAITPIVKDLVLVGGGHSHAIALKLLGMNPLPGVRLTLITDVYHTPYSGMLPGYVAGLYTYDECHIDLRPLSQFAHARLIVDRAIGIDLGKNQVICDHHPPIDFDLLSLDIGSTPATVTVPGAQDHAIPVKPISQFLTYWEQLMRELSDSSQQPTQSGAMGLGYSVKDAHFPIRLGIVGGGAGGVELALSVQARLERMQTRHPTYRPPELHLFHRGPELLPERHPRMRRLFQRLMVNRGIQLHLHDAVVAIEPTPAQPFPYQEKEGTPVSPLDKGGLRSVNVIGQSGMVVPCDRVFWVTSASAASWVAESGLATDDRGFIHVNDCLQSVSHPHVFAAGDIATMVNHPRPKAGVFAVRQGQPLYENLCRAVQDQPLKPFHPQKEFLILVGTGAERAIASRGAFSIGPSKYLWQWKDRIDRKFMDRFTHLSPMEKVESRKQTVKIRQKAKSKRQKQGKRATPKLKTQNSKLKTQNSPLSLPPPCSGCASKISKTVLDRVLQQFKPSSSTALIGLGTVSNMADNPADNLADNLADDAAVVQIPSGMALVQTVDYFRALLDDPFLVGQITTHHCLNDLYAMGADPHSAMAIATLPYAVPAKQENVLYLLLSGVVKVLTEAGAELIGGHTVEGDELALGLSCNGLAQPDRLWRKGGMRPGDRLIVTKALGTGTLFAADMQLRAKGHWIQDAIASMLQSNQPAMCCLRQHGATACTDVTGYGLAGHLLEMVTASQVSVTLTLDTIPAIPGAIATLEQGIFSSLYAENINVERAINVSAELQTNSLYPLLFDPQTSGGLLATVPEAQADACIIQLQSLGYSASQMIGQVTEKDLKGRPVIYLA